MKKISIAFIFLISSLAFSQKQSAQFKSGLSLIREQKYEEAILVLEKSIESQELSNQAASYYLIGVANLELENFSSALNSFETALDISKDPKLDAKIDEQIDKTIQRQNFYEAGKDKNRFSYYVGIGYDSNLLNLNKDNFVGTDLSSYSALYGLSLSHSLIRHLDFQLTPEVSVADSYSVNTTFAADSTIQSSDALQISLLLPAQFALDLFTDHDSISPQVGMKMLYLPTDTSKRSLAFNSINFTIKSVLNVSTSYIFLPQISYSMDKSSLTYTDSADDQSANRLTLDLNNTFLISEDKHQININLAGEQNAADGDNSSYNKIAAALEVRLSMIPTYNLGLSTKYIQTDYTKRTTVRNDRQNVVGLDVAKNFTVDQSLSMSLASSSRSSNSDLNAYQDMTLSMIFSDAYSF
jgi:tetratricopeptide (TPR) repeat protein